VFPQARLEKLAVREVAGQTLIYDLRHNQAHCLNRIAALVWKHCDGTKSVAELADLLPGEMDPRYAEAVVRLALEQLARRQLLQAA
jgi:hypothetical protein